MAQMLLNGALVGAQGGKTLQVRNPANGEIVGDIPRGTTADVDAAVSAAAKAFPGWAATPPSKRAAMMHEAARKMREVVDEVAKLLSLEQGKPLAHAKIEAWRVDYNQRRPHGSLGHLTPDEYPASTVSTDR